MDRDRGRKYVLALAVFVWILVGVAAVVYFVFAPHGAQQYLTVRKVDGPTNGSVVAFDAMTQGQQSVFTSAVTANDGTATIPGDVNASVWVDNDAVRYHDATYRVAVATAD